MPEYADLIPLGKSTQLSLPDDQVGTSVNDTKLRVARRYTPHLLLRVYGSASVPKVGMPRNWLRLGFGRCRG